MKSTSKVPSIFMLCNIVADFVSLPDIHALDQYLAATNGLAVIQAAETMRTNDFPRLLPSFFAARLILLGLFGVLVGTSSAVAQADSCRYVIEGRVFDQVTQEPLPLVSIQLLGTSMGATTDDDGYFRFSGLCEKEHDLLFSYIGYKQLQHHHDFHHPYIEIYLAPSSLLMESVLIEAEGPQAGISTTQTSSLTQEELQEVSSLSFGEAASRIAGVNTISTGQNIVKPVIHGLHSNRILVVNNGLRHEFQNWGTDHAPEVDPSMIDNLEVVKGAGTVRYGPDALGGVILIKPPKPDFNTRLRGEISLTGKSNGRSGEASAQLEKGFKWISLMASGSVLKQGDLHTPDYQLTNTGKEEYSYSGGFRLHPLPELFVEGYYSHFGQELGILRGSVNTNLDDLLNGLEADVPNFTMPFSYDINTPKQGVSHDLYKASAKWIGEQQSVSVQYGYQINRRQEFDVRRGNDLEIPNIDLELATHTVEGEWKHPSWGRLSGQLGVQYLQQANDNIPGTQTVPFIPNYDQERMGGYLIESLKLGNSTLEAGIRYDWQESYIVGRQPNNLIYRNTVEFQSVTATLGFRQKLTEHSTFRTNVGTAWRPPNIAELYRFGRHLSFLEYGLWRYTVLEDRDLISTRDILTEEDRPVPNENGYKWISSYELNREDLQIEATGYINYIENYIYARPAGLTATVRGTSPFFIYDQSNALFWGIDLSTRLTHSPQLASTLKGSYLWSQQVPENDFFVGQPPARLDYELRWQPTLKWLDESVFKLNAGYTFEQFQAPRILTVEEVIFAFRNDVDLFGENAADFDIAPPPEGFLLVNLSWRTTWKKWQCSVQVTNLFNTRYRMYTNRLRYFADEMGRNISLTVGYKF